MTDQDAQDYQDLTNGLRNLGLIAVAVPWVIGTIMIVFWSLNGALGHLVNDTPDQTTEAHP